MTLCRQLWQYIHIQISDSVSGFEVIKDRHQNQVNWNLVSWAIFLVVFIFAFWLRIEQSSLRPMWNDEGFQHKVSSWPIAKILGFVIEDDTHPPGFYLLSHFWLQFAGENVFFIRLLPVGLSVLAIILFFTFTRSLFDPIGRVAGSMVLAFSHFYFAYSVEFRSYSALILGAVLYCYALLRVYKNENMIWTILNLVIGTFFLSWIHTSGTIFLLFVSSFFLTLLYLKKKWSNKFTLYTCTVVLSFIIPMYYHLQQFTCCLGLVSKPGDVSLLHFLREVYFALFGESLPLAALSVLFLGISIAGPKRETKVVALMGLLAIISLPIFYILFNLFFDLFLRDRYVITSVFGLALIISSGFDQLKNSKILQICALSLLLHCLLNNLSLFRQYLNFYYWDKIANFIEDNPSLPVYFCGGWADDRTLHLALKPYQPKPILGKIDLCRHVDRWDAQNMPDRFYLIHTISSTSSRKSWPQVVRKTFKEFKILAIDGNFNNEILLLSRRKSL